MLTRNPIILSISFLGALTATAVIKGKTYLKLYLPLFLAITLANLLFSHNGETVLFYFCSQRITFESLFFGFGAALSIVGVIYWFKFAGCVFTSDKLMWAVGALSPKLAIVLTMALRFVPLFKENAAEIYNAQISMGKERGVKTALLSFSALISLSIENTVETADTMRARGFGRGRRTTYSIFKMTAYDRIFTALIILCDALLIYFFMSGAARFWYYPRIVNSGFSYKAIALYIVFAAFCAAPVLNEVKEEVWWRFCVSKI